MQAPAHPSEAGRQRNTSDIDATAQAPALAHGTAAATAAVTATQNYAPN